MKKKFFIGVGITLGVLILIGGVLFGYKYFERKNSKLDVPSESENIVKINKELKVFTGDLVDNNLWLEKPDNNIEIQISYKNKNSENEIEFVTKYFDLEDKEVSKDVAINKDALKDGYKEKKYYYSVGTYEVNIKILDDEYQSTLIVNDKTNPKLEVKNVKITEGADVNLSSFVVSCTDNSKEECKLRIIDKDNNEIKDLDKSFGERKYFIEASDKSGNKVSQEVVLKVNKKKTTNNQASSKPTNSKPTNSQSNKKPASSNSTSANNTTSSTNSNPANNTTSSSTTKKTVVSKEDISENKDVAGKYGVTGVETSKYRVTTYNDGTVDKKFINKYLKYDHSKFNATSQDILGEAKEVAAKNQATYNEMLTYVNQYRSEVNVAPLTIDNNLSTLATIRAIEMAWSAQFSHTRPNGSSCFSIYDEFNYNYLFAAENIAWNQRTVAQVSLGWKKSPGHYSNMINSSATKIGFGKYTVNGENYWVQLFA